MIFQMEEDPMLVVDCVVDQLTVFSPVLNNFPGTTAKFLSWFFWLTPQSLKHVVEVVPYYLKQYGPYSEVLRSYQEQQGEQQ
jgi:hypothetical protein